MGETNVANQISESKSSSFKSTTKVRRRSSTESISFEDQVIDWPPIELNSMTMTEIKNRMSEDEVATKMITNHLLQFAETHASYATKLRDTLKDPNVDENCNCKTIYGLPQNKEGMIGAFNEWAQGIVDFSHFIEDFSEFLASKGIINELIEGHFLHAWLCYFTVSS